MTSTEQQLIERIERLETRNRRLTIACGAVGAILIAASAMGFRSGGPESLGGVTFEDGVVTAKFVKIVDKEGKSRIELGDDPEGLGRRSKSFGMVIRDPKGLERFGLGVTEDDTVAMGFDAAGGVGTSMRDRIAISVSPDGSATIMLIDNKTLAPVRLVTDPDGGGGLELIDYDYETKEFIVKRTDFNGETIEKISNDGE